MARTWLKCVWILVEEIWTISLILIPLVYQKKEVGWIFICLKVMKELTMWSAKNCIPKQNQYSKSIIDISYFAQICIDEMLMQLLMHYFIIYQIAFTDHCNLNIVCKYYNGLRDDSFYCFTPNLYCAFRTKKGTI